MSDAMIAHVLRLSNPDLSSGAHKLLILLAHHTNYKTGLACPGHRLLAQEMRVTERHIKRLVRELVKVGLLDVDGHGGRGHRQEYRILPSAGEESPEEAFTRLAATITTKESQRLADLPYEEFLRTRYWGIVRAYMLAKYRACQLCMSDERLQVHHRSYRFRGSEVHHLEDLTVLCDPCHRRVHTA